MARDDERAVGRIDALIKASAGEKRWAERLDMARVASWLSVSRPDPAAAAAAAALVASPRPALVAAKRKVDACLADV